MRLASLAQRHAARDAAVAADVAADLAAGEAVAAVDLPADEAAAAVTAGEPGADVGAGKASARTGSWPCWSQAAKQLSRSATSPSPNLSRKHRPINRHFNFAKPSSGLHKTQVWIAYPLVVGGVARLRFEKH